MQPLPLPLSPVSRFTRSVEATTLFFFSFTKRRAERWDRFAGVVTRFFRLSRDSSSSNRQASESEWILGATRLRQIAARSSRNARPLDFAAFFFRDRPYLAPDNFISRKRRKREVDGNEALITERSDPLLRRHLPFRHDWPALLKF